MSENFPTIGLPERFPLDSEKLERLGVKPGVYTYNQTGDEYYPFTTCFGMKLEDDGGDNIVYPELVTYIGLYDHPKFGRHAVWHRPPEEFLRVMTWNREEV